MSEIIYLDNNATTAIASEALDAMWPYLTTHYGNPSSVHSFGGEVAQAVESARVALANLLGCQTSKEILFTSCGTESDNTAIYSALVCQKGRNRVVTSQVEHPAVLNVCKELERRGYDVIYLPVNERGQLNMADAQNAINEQTALVTIMWANNETGTLFPVEELAKMAHAVGAIFHTDAVQAVGKFKIDLKNSAIDMLSLSGHKLHAPKGIGALYIRRGLRFKPFMLGGHQESGRRAGTENVPYIVALGAVSDLIEKEIEDENSRVKTLRDNLEKGLLERIPQCRVNGDLENRLPNTSSISFDYIEGEAILLHLNEHHICASSGSACTTGSLEPSHVLRAMGLPYTAAHGTLRFSLSRYTTQDEIDRVIELLPPIIAHLRSLSPYWNAS